MSTQLTTPTPKFQFRQKLFYIQPNFDYYLARCQKCQGRGYLNLAPTERTKTLVCPKCEGKKKVEYCRNKSGISSEVFVSGIYIEEDDGKFIIKYKITNADSQTWTWCKEHELFTSVKEALVAIKTRKKGLKKNKK